MLAAERLSPYHRTRRCGSSHSGRSALFGVGALLLATAACAPRAAAPPAPPAAADEPAAPGAVRLNAADVQSLARLLRMEDTRELDLPLIERLLRDDAAEVRGRAALATGRLRDRRATPALLQALNDPDAAVRARAAFALGLLGDSSASVVHGLGNLALRDAPGPAAEAAAALGRLGAAAGGAYVDSLLATGRAAIIRHEALLAAWRLPRNPATTAAVTRWTAHTDPETRWRAVYSLARAAGPAAVPTLVGAMTDIDAGVRANAARGLRAPVADSAGQRRQALDALVVAAEDPHPHVRINALRALPAYGEAARTTPLLVARLHEADVNVAIAAAQALAEAADPSAAGELAAMSSQPERAVGLRTAALAAWMRLDAAGAATSAAAWADSSRWILRLHAARALGTAPWNVASATLERLARDPHTVVAAEALTAIRTSADTLPGTRRIFVERLGSADPLVRAAAARGLARHAGVADLDLLLGAFERARTDTVRDAAVAVAEALGRLAADGIPVDRAFFLRFGPRGAPPDPAVHRAIVEHVGSPPASWGEPRSAPEPRPLAFYSDLVERLVAPVLAGAEPPAVAIATPHGEFTLELAAADAPLTTHNFLSLVGRGYYTGTRWHRVVPNFVIQDGDPRGDGSGGPGYVIRDEINTLRYLRGTLGMALAGPDTGGSQFFVTHSPQPHLDGGYTIFGRVVDGMNAVDAVVQEEPILGFRRIR
jgi:cyclophilin family peptidyl-prolyl cis-trans isomerase/HEAT repeat protein